MKYNDDGEPQGTAGNPILKVILGKGLINVLVIVTRYFGGILLGTGGLARAYSNSTIKALEKTKYVKKTIGYQVKLSIGYDKLKQFKYYAKNNNINIIHIEYLENVEIIVEMRKETLEKITNKGNKKPLKSLKCDILVKKFVDI